MSISTLTNTVSYTSSGTVGPYAFTFPIDAATDLIVTETTPAGAVTTLDQADYTVTAASGGFTNGGTVTLDTACPSGYTLTILRDTAMTQLSVFTEGMPTLYETFEDALDKLTMIAQDIETPTVVVAVIVAAVKADTDIASAIALKHTQNTDQYLDYGGASQVAVGGVNAAVNERHVQGTDDKGASICVFASDESVSVKEGAIGFVVPAVLNGYNLSAVVARVYAKGVTGNTTVMLRRSLAGTDVEMLSAGVVLGDVFSSTTCTINASYSGVITGTMIFVDVDTVHSGTAPLGLSVGLSFTKP